MKRVVILGGGISGLLAGWVFREFRPTILEASDALGGSFAAGGLKYVRRTDAFVRMLDELGIPFTTYQPRGGLLLSAGARVGGSLLTQNGDTIVPHPSYLRDITPGLRLGIQRQHWERTRGSGAGFLPTCMNDPMGEGSDAALRFDYATFTEAVAASIQKARGRILTKTRVTDIKPDGYVGTSTDWFASDLLVTTLPLGLTAKLAPHLNLPPGQFQWATIGIFNGGLARCFRELGGEQYDYLYTPWLPVVHRLSRDADKPDTWEAEAVGKVSIETFQSIWSWDSRPPMALQNIPGHLLPLEREPNWPAGIVPLGRFAEWNSRSTAEKSLARALALRDQL